MMHGLFWLYMQLAGKIPTRGVYQIRHCDIASYVAEFCFTWYYIGCYSEAMARQLRWKGFAKLTGKRLSSKLRGKYAAVLWYLCCSLEEDKRAAEQEYDRVPKQGVRFWQHSRLGRRSITVCLKKSAFVFLKINLWKIDQFQ